MRHVLALLVLVPMTAWSSDAHRLSFLEQEVRNLQRQVQSLSRQLDEVRTRPDRPANPLATALPPSSATSGQWIDAAKWRRVRPGMGMQRISACV